MSEELPSIKTIAIIGGTGKEGKGLAYRWLKAGYRVLIGSRQAEKAVAAADELCLLAGGSVDVLGMTNPEAAEKADLVVLTVPYTAHRQTLEGLVGHMDGKILISATVPIVPPKVTRVQMPSEGSATLEAQAILGDQVQVVAAFQSVSHERLLNDEDVGCDVLVSGTGKAARSVVLKLVRDAGMVGYDAGPIENSAAVEGLAAVLIGINKQFGVKSAGIKIIGLQPDTSQPEG